MEFQTARQILRGVPHPVLVLDRAERIRVVNPSAEALFGSAAEGRHFGLTLRQPSLVTAIDRAFSTQSETDGRYVHAGMEGDVIYNVTISPFVSDDARGLVLSFADRTSEATAGQMRRDFVANVSHELRTPLTSLLGFIETLRGPARNDAEARDRFLAVMAEEAGRMNRLVHDLLSLSRVEEVVRVRPSAQVDLRQVVESAILSLLADPEQTRIQVVTAAASTLVKGDADQLRQVLQNLLENALKYSDPAASITVQLSEVARDPVLRTRAMRIDVMDQGEGIPHHHIPRLTERFYRVDSHRSREMGGTGLGLAIVKHIVARHRGRLKISSESGRGSTFSVILPMA